ncbi:MAG: hypothetical protein ACFFAO_08750 [Candidatus Hermodarchaeota archaeon]
MEDLLSESKVKDVLYLSRFKRIIQFAPIRTGSTILWQILDYLFEDRNYTKYKWKSPNHVVKTHKLHKKYIKEGNIYLITIRNPLEAFASTIRVKFFEHPLSEIYEMVNKLLIDMYEKVYEIQNNPNVYIFRYEDFQHNYNVFLDKIEELFDIKIKENHKAEILKKFSRESNLEISRNYNNFQELDQNSLIHGNHVAEKQYSWKDIIQDEDMQKDLIIKFKSIMKKFDYKIPD